MTESQTIELVASIVAATPIRPTRYQTRHYEAFRAVGGLSIDKTVALPFAAPPTSLYEARNTAQVRCFHKDHLLIREASEDGVKLHLFAIRKGKPKWVHPAGEITPRRVEDYYADPICIFDGGVLYGALLEVVR